MINLKRHPIRLVYIACDVFCAYVAIFLACLVRNQQVPFDLNFHSILFDDYNPFRLIFALWVVIIVVVHYMHRLYYTDRTSSEILELVKVFQSNIIATTLVIVLGYILKAEGLPRSVVGISFVFMVLFFSIWRILKRIFVEYLVIRGYNNRNVLIIGAGRVGKILRDEIERHPGMGMKVKGFLDDFKDQVNPELKSDVLGKLSDFHQVVTQNFIEHVFVTIHHDEDVFLKLFSQAKKLGIAVDVVPSGYGIVTGDIVKHNLGFIPLLEYSQIGNGQHHFGKRIFDLAAAWAGSLVLAIPFLIIGIILVLDDRGPVFYLSERFGRGGKRFYMFKFRTMKVGAEQLQQGLLDKNEVDGPIFKIRNDPRITRFGRFLRKYSLDELPQLFNVIKGDMSLVGPRPFPVDQIERSDLRQLRRLGIRPGITGLWQVKGRSDVAFSRLLRWDIWYINNWSFRLDLNILWQTIPVIFKGRGAY